MAKEKKLRILAAGDLHGSLDIARKISDKARKEKVDLVVLAGDLHGYMGEGKGILDVFEKRGQKVAFVPGNLDFEDELEGLGKGRNIHGYYVNYSGVGIVGIGSPNWKMDLDSRDLDLLSKNFSRMKVGKKILVSHLHASGTRAEKMGFEGWTGDDVLREAVLKFKPDVLISAHIHEAEGIEDKVGRTRVLQVGRGGTVLEV